MNRRVCYDGGLLVGLWDLHDCRFWFIRQTGTVIHAISALHLGQFKCNDAYGLLDPLLQLLPKMFAHLLDCREPSELKLRKVYNRRTTMWNMEVVFDRAGRMFLKGGWEQFSHTYGLKPDFILIFHYDGDSMFNVKIFDRWMCRVHYNDNFGTRFWSPKWKLCKFVWSNIYCWILSCIFVGWWTCRIINMDAAGFVFFKVILDTSSEKLVW